MPGNKKTTVQLIDTMYLLQTFFEYPHLPDNRNYCMTLQLNVHSANILHDAKYDMPSSYRGPLANHRQILW